jgi:hypothetical protein
MGQMSDVMSPTSDESLRTVRPVGAMEAVSRSSASSGTTNLR